MIQYSGNLATINFTGQSSRQNLINTLVDHLETRGWTVTSGEGTGTVVLRSGLTPQNLRMKIKIHTNCNAAVIGFAIMNDAESRTTTADSNGNGFLKWGTQYSYQMYASPYQVFILSYGLVTHENVAWGTLWIPSFMEASTTNAMWCAGITTGDTQTALYASWRYYCVLAASTNWGAIANDTVVESRGDVVWRNGQIYFFWPRPHDTDTQIEIHRWQVTGHVPMWDPLVTWSVGINRDAAGVIQGQLWDAAITQAGEYGIDQSLAIDGHNWRVMNSDYPAQDSTSPRGQLIIATS